VVVIGEFPPQLVLKIAATAATINPRETADTWREDEVVKRIKPSKLSTSRAEPTSEPTLPAWARSKAQHQHAEYSAESIRRFIDL
jgi:hypothetical protein